MSIALGAQIAAQTDTIDRYGDGQLAANATFTRDSESTVVDFEGNIRDIPEDVPAIDGLRVVRNLATGVVTESITVVSGKTYQVTIAGDAGTTCVASNAFSGTLTADGANRISWDDGTPKTAASTTLTLTITGTLTELLVEDVTGRANQNPSEWVESCEYFTYENGNTVDENGVVTEAQGAPITNPAVPIGLRYHEAGTELVLHSVATDSWAAPGGGANKHPLSLYELGIFPGLQVVSQGAVWHRVNVDASLSAGTTYYVTYYIKKGTSGHARLDLRGSAQSSRMEGVFGNIEVVSESAGSLTLIDQVELQPDVWRIRVVFIPDVTENLSLGIGPWSEVSGETVIALGASINGDTFLPFIRTAGAPVTRATDVLSYSDIPAENQTRIVKIDGTTEIEDWDGDLETYGILKRITVKER